MSTHLHDQRPRSVLVCGGRHFNDVALFCRVMDQHNLRASGIVRVVHGGATGADAMADEWARAAGLEVVKYPADWSRGRRAGPERNAAMLANENVVLVVAFPGGRGTANMVRLAMELALLLDGPRYPREIHVVY